VTTHDPILLYFIAVVGLFVLVVVRRHMQQLKRDDPTWDKEKITTWKESDMERCVYCGEKDTSNRDSANDPCCLRCESFLYP